MNVASRDTGVSGAMKRCWWCGEDDLYVSYHDLEWGVPVTDDERLFEKLALEGFQSGLSWITILRKRPRFREVFADFRPDRVARFTERDVKRLLNDPGIIRHRGKIEAVINNARAFSELVAREGSLSRFVWHFAPAQTRAPMRRQDIPAQTDASQAFSRELKKRGWRFVGPTTAYAFFQSMGIVNDHVADCFRRDACADLRATTLKRLSD
jgi:DNA-3-methyladenine glycosylase I